MTKTTLDKDLLFEEEGEDIYAAAGGGSSGRGSKPAGDDDEDATDDEPSVEAEIAAQENGLTEQGDHPPKKDKLKQDSELDEEERAADELRMIEELAEDVEKERDELLGEEEEGL